MNILYMGLSLCTFVETGWKCHDNTCMSTCTSGRTLTNISEVYNDFIMKMLKTILVNNEPHLHNLPIIPIMVNEHKVMALIDTGAEGTCINNELAKRIELKRNGKDGFVKTISDKEVTRTIGYDAKLNWVASNGYDPVDGFPHSLSGIAFPKETKGYDVIIGRDILQNIIVTYNGKLKQIEVAWGHYEATL